MKIKVILVALVLTLIVVSFLNQSIQSVSSSSAPTYYQANTNVTYVSDYIITLSGIPSGKGIYQQFITLHDPSNYGINSRGSNELFYSQNGTELYAWIQSINSTSMQVWVKNFNNSSQINLEIYSSVENLFSKTGYLGEAPQLSSIYGEYFNAPQVFDYAVDFAGTSLPSGWSGSGTYSVNNTLTINGTSSEGTSVQTNSYFNPLKQTLVISGFFDNLSAKVFYITWGVSGTLYRITSLAGTYILQNVNVGGYNNVNLSGGSSSTFNLFQLGANKTSDVSYASIDNRQCVSNSVYFTPKSSMYIALQYEGEPSYKEAFFQYVLLRNTVQMPSYNIGSRIPYYSITFSESGLSSGTLWCIKLNGITQSSSNNIITFYEPNGTYSYVIQGTSGYQTGNYSGVIVINGDSINESIVWSTIIYSIRITEYEKSNSQSWSATLTGKTLIGQAVNVTSSSTGDTVTFNEPDGTYSYIIHPSSGFMGASGYSGIILVTGNVSITIFDRNINEINPGIPIVLNIWIPLIALIVTIFIAVVIIKELGVTRKRIEGKK